jgi:hypothetical protein
VIGDGIEHLDGGVDGRQRDDHGLRLAVGVMPLKRGGSVELFPRGSRVHRAVEDRVRAVEHERGGPSN